jgi:hypothetical protein
MLPWLSDCEVIAVTNRDAARAVIEAKRGGIEVEAKNLILVSFGAAPGAGFWIDGKRAAERVYSFIVDGRAEGRGNLFGASDEAVAECRSIILRACAKKRAELDAEGVSAPVGGIPEFAGLVGGAILDIIIKLLPTLLPILLGLCPA